LAIAVVIAAVCAGAARGAHVRRSTCWPPHTRTLVATSRARVFSTRQVVQHAHRTYGCLFSRARAYAFSLPDFPIGFAPIALAGGFVAYGDYSDCAASFCDPNSVVVQDLRNGRVRFVDGPEIRVAHVSRLVLTAAGSVAWIASVYDANGEVVPGVQVVKAEYGVKPVVLDSGPDIDAHSLALGGSTLYWTKAGTPRSASLR
jgi:hypothetical protein